MQKINLLYKNLKLIMLSRDTMSSSRVARDGPCIFTRDQKLSRDYQISITVDRVDNKLNR